MSHLESGAFSSFTGGLIQKEKEKEKGEKVLDK
jgi:hypothetical protein